MPIGLARLYVRGNWVCSAAYALALPRRLAHWRLRPSSTLATAHA